MYLSYINWKKYEEVSSCKYFYNDDYLEGIESKENPNHKCDIFDTVKNILFFLHL